MVSGVFGATVTEDVPFTVTEFIVGLWGLSAEIILLSDKRLKIKIPKLNIHNFFINFF
jgi:hypothetical protein